MMTACIINEFCIIDFLKLRGLVSNFLNNYHMATKLTRNVFYNKIICLKWLVATLCIINELFMIRYPKLGVFFYHHENSQLFVSKSFQNRPKMQRSLPVTPYGFSLSEQTTS